MINPTFEELRSSGKLPSPSGIGMQILRLTRGDDFSTEEIGQVISADSALTGRLLMLANSAESAAREPITTIEEATIRLGIRTVRNVALGLSLVASNRSGACVAFDYDEYWSRSLARAVAGQLLSRTLERGVPAEMYILGLLASIGTLALASTHPESYTEVLRDPEIRTPDELCQAEKRDFEIDHRDIASCMLQEWGLPREFASAARDFETCDLSAGEDGLKSTTQILSAADLLSRLCTTGPQTTRELWDELLSAFKELEQASGMEGEEFRRLCTSAAAEWREWGEVLGIPTMNEVDFQRLEEQAEAAHSGGAAGQPSAPAPSGGAKASVEDEIPREFEDLAMDFSMNVLAVDDDPVSLKILERHLSQAGHNVMTASDGEEALRRSLEVIPHLVVADWSMPGLDGIELCRALRRISSGQRIYYLLLTGTQDEESVVQAFDSGVDDYITKPFNPRILLARINAGRRIITLQNQVEEEKTKQKRQMMDLQILTRKLRSAALTDPLTDLPNRRYAMRRLAQTWEASSRTSRPMSVIMMDIDHFKSVNDTFGHDAGDAVLKGVAAVLKESSREDDDFCRIGGEEFVVICANTDVEQVAITAERLRRDIEASPIEWQGHTHNVTMSLGVATREATTSDYESLLKMADEAVYVAKTGGRNQVAVAEVNLGERRKSA